MLGIFYVFLKFDVYRKINIVLIKKIDFVFFVGVFEGIILFGFIVCVWC